MLQNTQKITLFNLYEIHINDTNTRPRNYKNKIVDQHSLWWHMQTSLTICYQSSMIIVVVFIQSLSCVQLCDPMDCSMLGFPVLHHLLELTQTHVHWVNDAIQPPHPLLPLISGLDGKACNAGDPVSIPGLERSTGEGNGNPLQYSCLGSPMDRGAWGVTVHGIAKVLDTSERLSTSLTTIDVKDLFTWLFNTHISCLIMFLLKLAY